MSGLFGVLDSRGSPPGRLLARITEKLSHRPWHVVDTYTDEAAGVGLGRIGIGIFNQERQPRSSEDGNIVVFLSGEFYRTAGLRRELEAAGHHLRDETDVELALRLYEARGDLFASDLEGVFLLTIWDRTHQALIIANDRAGLCPLLYAHYKGKLVFAPEMKAILCAPDFAKELDLIALAEYVRFQCLLGDKTFFAGLKVLPSAVSLRYQLETDRLTIRPYWDVSRIQEFPATVSFDDVVDQTGRLLKAAVDNLTTGNHRLGAYLSGGVDSRAILGLIDPGLFPVTTITFGRRDSRDAIYARKIAAAAGTRHHFFELADGEWVKDYADLHLQLTEGFHSWIHSHGISILDRVRSLIDVNLTGFPGAEINWEDPSLFGAPDDHAFCCHLFDLLCQKTTWPSLNEAEQRLLFAPEIAQQMQGLAFDSLRTELAKLSHMSYPQRAAHLSMMFDRRMYQYHTVFHRAFIEERFPFSDYAYVDFIHAVPPEMRFQRKLRRAVILKMMRPLARIPYDKDDLPITSHEVSRLIAKLVRNSKSYVNAHIAAVFPSYTTLYVDYESWLRHELRDWGEGILFGNRTLERGLFSPEFLRSLWHRHQSGLEPNMVGKLAPLMTYEMMLRTLYDDLPSTNRLADSNDASLTDRLDRHVGQTDLMQPAMADRGAAAASSRRS